MNKLVITAAVAMLLPSMALASDDWRFLLSPYLWLAGVDGDTATIPPLPSAPIDISPSDAIEDTEVSYMLVFAAKRGRHGIIADLLYTDLRSDEKLVEAFDLSLTSVSKNQMYTLAYSYELRSDSGSVLDAFAGARYWDVDTSLRFGGGLGLLAGKRIESSESWVDPVVGLKGRTALGSSRFYLAGWAGVGGFEANSELFYDVSLNLGYQWSDSIGTSLGYRLLDVDYDDDGFLYDLQQYGVMLGLTWQF